MMKRKHKEKLEWLSSDVEFNSKRINRIDKELKHQKALVKIMVLLWVALAFFLVYHKNLF
jgi:hypothetical protein